MRKLVVGRTTVIVSVRRQVELALAAMALTKIKFLKISVILILLVGDWGGPDFPHLCIQSAYRPEVLADCKNVLFSPVAACGHQPADGVGTRLGFLLVILIVGLKNSLNCRRVSIMPLSRRLLAILSSQPLRVL